MHRVILFSTACIFVTIASFFQVLPIATSEFIQKTQSLTISHIAILSSFFFISYGILQIPCGIILDKFGVRLILPISLFIATLCCILYWLNITPLTLGISRALLGLGSAVSYIAAIYIAIQFFPIKYLPLLIGILESISTIGDILATKLYKIYLNTVGWNNSNATITFICALLCLISSILSLKKQAYNSTYRSNNKTASQIFSEIINTFKNNTFLGVIIYSFFTWLYMMSFAGYWGKSYFMHTHNLSELESLSIIQYFWIGFLVASLIVGPISAKLNTKRPIILLLSFMGTIMFLVMGLPILFNYYTLISMAIIIGISASGIVIAFAMIADIIPQSSHGTAMGINNTAMILGAAIGQSLFGYILLHYDLGKYFSINIDTHYYTALLIFPISAIFALIGIALSTKGLK